MITINAADKPAGRPGITDPLPLTAPLLDALDAEIRATLAPGRIITPDEVRGTAATLSEGVRRRGWPTLAETRGRLYFVLDVRAEVGDLYRAGHPSLKGRPIFGWYDPATPEGVVQIVQDPLVDGAKILDWVRSGVIVRTRSDLPYDFFTGERRDVVRRRPDGGFELAQRLILLDQTVLLSYNLSVFL